MIPILIVGPFPYPISGVSLANKVINENLQKDKRFSTAIVNSSMPGFDEAIGKFSFKKVWYFFKLNLKAIKVAKADIIYITPGQTFLGVLKYGPFFLLSKILGKNTVVHIHGNHIRNEYETLSELKSLIFKFFLGSATKGIVLSESMRHNLDPFLLDSDIYAVGNFVEPYLFENKQEKEADNELRILFLSNLMKEKGILDLLQALRQLEDSEFHFKAKIAGNIDPSSEKEILFLIDKLQNVEYCGVVYGDRKKELLLWSDIFILPTYYAMEGQPISILEAMATRNYIITTKHSGIPDIVEENVNGMFVEPKSPQTIVDAVLNVDSLESLADVKEMNFQKALNNFTTDLFVDKIAKIFIELTSEKR